MMFHAFRIIFTLVAVIDVTIQNLTLKTIWNCKDGKRQEVAR